MSLLRRAVSSLLLLFVALPALAANPQDTWDGCGTQLALLTADIAASEVTHSRAEPVTLEELGWKVEYNLNFERIRYQGRGFEEAIVEAVSHPSGLYSQREVSLKNRGYVPVRKRVWLVWRMGNRPSVADFRIQMISEFQTPSSGETAEIRADLDLDFISNGYWRVVDFGFKE